MQDPSHIVTVHRTIENRIRAHDECAIYSRGGAWMALPAACGNASLHMRRRGEDEER